MGPAETIPGIDTAQLARRGAEPHGFRAPGAAPERARVPGNGLARVFSVLRNAGVAQVALCATAARSMDERETAPTPLPGQEQA
eukprot:8972649-Alexandrium_andersonii.AAC.1